MILEKPQIHRYSYIIALSLLAASLPFSLFMLSVAQFALLFNWLLDGNIKYKLHSFIKNKPAVIFSLLFLMHLVGLLYTSDFNYAFKDIRTKIPLLLLPLIMATSEPLNKKELKIIISFFIAAVIVATGINTIYYLTNMVSDIRETSLFISHIRFSLMICLSIILLIEQIIEEQQKKIIIISSFLLIVWLILFLLLFESVTGLSVMTVLVIFFLLQILFKKNNRLYRFISLTIIITLFAGTYLYLSNVINEYYYKNPVDFSGLESYTSRGNPYVHDTTTSQSENGHLIWIYISKEELEEEWKKRSTYDFNGLDEKNQYLQFTLIRYLASKGLRKDGDALCSLSDEEIKAIEKGIPSSSFFEKMTIKKRIHQILWEYENYKKDGNANGLSVMLRVEFYKAAWGILKNNIIFGVGTGDVNNAFKKYYEDTNSLLKPEYRWRSHNQYLSFTVAFGVIGFIVFMLSMIYPPFLLSRFKHYTYLSFFIIIILSMLTEDTLETQIGVTFYSYFSALFLFAIQNKNNSV